MLKRMNRANDAEWGVTSRKIFFGDVIAVTGHEERGSGLREN